MLVHPDSVEAAICMCSRAHDNAGCWLTGAAKANPKLSSCVLLTCARLACLQGRLPEIEVLQKQISKAHEELSDLRFKLEEQRAAAASKEQQLNSDKQQLQSQVEALSHQRERLQLEVDAATTRAANNEKQQQELYELCNTLQGEWARRAKRHSTLSVEECVCMLCRPCPRPEQADSTTPQPQSVRSPMLVLF